MRSLLVVASLILSIAACSDRDGGSPAADAGSDAVVRNDGSVADVGVMDMPIVDAFTPDVVAVDVVAVDAVAVDVVVVDVPVIDLAVTDTGAVDAGPVACDDIGTVCDATEYCDLPDDISVDEEHFYCAGESVDGVCRARPGTEPGDCLAGSSQVCGCNRVTYDNECDAYRAGTDIWTFGPCPPPPTDCRETGCDGTDVCMFCGIGYACLPDGAIC